jgi:signal transduction histidine kinase
MDAAARIPEKEFVIEAQATASKRGMTALGIMLALLATVVSGAVIFWILTLAVNWYNTPFLGVMVSHTLSVTSTQPIGDTWEGLKAGIRPQDRITAVSIEGNTFTPDPADPNAVTKLNELLAQSKRGQIATIDVSRPPGRRTSDVACGTYTSDEILCSFRVVLSQYPLIDFLAAFGLPYLVGVLFFIFGVFTLFRYARSVSSAPRAFAALCCCIGVVIGGLFDLNTSHQSLILWLFASCISAGLMMQLAMVFPYEVALVRRTPSLRFAPILIGLLLFSACYSFYVQRTINTYSGLQLIVVVGMAIAALLLIGSLIVRRNQAPSPISREQAGVVLVAMLVALTPLAVWFITFGIDRIIGTPTLAFPNFFVVPTLLVVPLGFSYAFSERRLLDVDRVLREASIYGLLGAALVVGYTLVTYALYLVTWNLVKWDNPILIALTVFGIAVFFVPVRTRLERFLDRTFFRQRRVYEQNIEAFARRLTTVVESNDAARTLIDQIDETLYPQYAFVFLRNPLTGEYEPALDPVTGKRGTDVTFSPGSPLLNHFGSSNLPLLYVSPSQPLPPELGSERSRLAVLGTPVIARLRTANRLNGFLAIGPRRDGSSYSYEDLRYIEGLSDQAALAFERAQVIVESQRNENELRVLSQVSAALNITMDFDTLLEFIFNQTDKVIRAPNFYIALKVANSDELVFAFYQENDERLSEREGYRWRAGGDLFSEVIRLQQPLRVDNYTLEAGRRGLNPLLDTPIRAWIGVPLNAGTGVPLGVVALGTTEAGVNYTQDQVSIFSSIADLAATALDKARLFRETEERARQLSVLNDISTQLAAQFENVDALLQTITRNAVEILRAEAGSLLLIDETNEELVFEVAIGGAGDKLVGTRIPPGVGIVGRVVETRQHVIVNEAQNSPDWFGEVADRRQEETFKTSSILAVPLAARGHVIGVLELINKRDGTIFVQTDVNLLTTFASAAAIAIENARLFRMTDQQLAIRVKQLDNMARIDQELNRTLDLRAVIDLTLDNALRESNADAGALALVRTEPLGFEIVGSIGYPPKTYTKGEIYPIDLGVIGRVYRTGSASLVTELEQDADYIETLPGAVGQLAVPMITAGRGVTAVLLLETRQPGIFNMMNMSFITALAEHANTAITNSQLFAQLQQANAARTQFVGYVAHELKQPMTSIKAYSESLLSGMTGGLSDMQKNFVNVISRNTSRLQQIVDDLKDVTALETGVLNVRKRSISFNGLIVEAIRPFQQRLAEKQQTLVLEVPDKLPYVDGDEGRLIQVLTNFISNAHKYTPEGGKITVFAEPADNKWDPDAAPRVIHCYVRDTGIGMDDDDLRRLSTPYFRSKNPAAESQEGTGLGMTITYALVEAHGGQVWVESELGIGSTFHFTIPISLDQSED